MPTYQLVNPLLGGNISSSFNATNPLNAAQSAWVQLSNYLTNDVPHFAFSLQDDNNNLHHYEVKESVDAKKVASYSINNIHVKLSPKQVAGFQKLTSNMLNKINSAKGGSVKGGKRHKKHDDSSSSSSSSSSSNDALDDAIKRMKYKAMMQNQPLYYFWYNPLVYDTVDLYMPTFTVPISPYVHINLNSAFLI